MSGAMPRNAYPYGAWHAGVLLQQRFHLPTRGAYDLGKRAVARSVNFQAFPAQDVDEQAFDMVVTLFVNMNHDGTSPPGFADVASLQVAGKHHVGRAAAFGWPMGKLVNMAQ